MSHKAESEEKWKRGRGMQSGAKEKHLLDHPAHLQIVTKTEPLALQSPYARR